MANPAYVAAQKAKPTPAFNTDCVDNGGGHFTKREPNGVPEVVKPVGCYTP